LVYQFLFRAYHILVIKKSDFNKIGFFFEFFSPYFLNPIEVKDIEDYFVYDHLTLEILPKHKEGTEELKKLTIEPLAKLTKNDFF